MIERYMEKNLFRQIVLLENLYTSTRVPIKKMAELLDVFPKTIESDIEKIIIEFDYAIQTSNKSRSLYYVLFDQEIPLYKLKQSIYQQSIFLKVCGHFALDKFDYLELVETDFISVSKAYALKNQALDFFNRIGLKESKGQLVLSEIEWRLVSLNVLIRLDEGLDFTHPVDFEIACEELIDTIENKFSKRVYDKDSKYFIIQGMYLSYQRQLENPVQFDSFYKAEIRRRPIYTNIVTAWQESKLKEYINESEIEFITFLFNACPYSFEQINDLFEDHEEVRKIFITSKPKMVELVETFSELAEKNLLGNQPFEQALMRLFRTAWRNYQPLIPDRTYLLAPSLVPIYSIVTSIIIKWGEEFDNELHLDQNSINRFIDECAQYLLVKRTVVNIIIVTDSHSKYLIYKDLLRSNIFEPRIDPRIYHDLDELDLLEVKKKNAMILCERRLLKEVSDESIDILPISLNKVTELGFIITFFQWVETNRNKQREKAVRRK
ncbi:hypothetical protein ACYSNW_02005 [Enterococcus sp. LJL99]